MPSFLSPIISLLGPVLFKLVLKYLDKKYPGLSPIIKEVLKYIESQPSPAAGVENFREVLTTSAKLPDTVKI
jgi:hypothetical protein